MILFRWIGLVGLLLMQATCSSEGGVVGSGISAISGNVAEVNLEATGDGGTAAATLLPFAITVSVIEVPELTATTDADGAFEVAGEFSGPITLRFAEAARDIELATLGLDVPAGSMIVLEDIRIVARQVLARLVRQLDFVGRVRLVDCDAGKAGILLVNDIAPGKESHQFMIELQADTVIAGVRRRPITCANIRRGDLVLIEGRIRVAVLNPDRVIVAESVTVRLPTRAAPVRLTPAHHGALLRTIQREPARATMKKG